MSAGLIGLLLKPDLIREASRRSITVPEEFAELSFPLAAGLVILIRIVGNRCRHFP